MTSPFASTAKGSGDAIDSSEVRRSLGLLISPGQTFELRGISTPHARSLICSGDDIDSAVKAAESLSDCNGTYYTLNPLIQGVTRAAKEADVESRKWVLIDVDTAKARAGESATEAEKEASGEVGFVIVDYLSGLGWPQPLVIDSGNGWHLLYRVDLPNTKLSQAIAKAALVHLAGKFDCPVAKIDTSVHNASRIAKLPGTWVRKGTPTEERPHRIARLVFAPPVVAVPVESLQALGEPTRGPAQPKGDDPSPFASSASPSQSGDLARYCQKIIESEVLKVAMSPEGSRNNRLNASAFALGTLDHWVEIDSAKTKQALIEAGIRIGLSDQECRQTVESGWLAGSSRPRDRPAPQHGVVRGSVIPAGKKHTIGLDEVKEEKVDWIWENRIATGFISIWAGPTSMGKSFVLHDVIARLSRGDSLPFSSAKHAPMSTLIISEDPIAQMLAPRLIGIGAVRSMVRFMRWDSMGIFTLDNIQMLEESCNEFHQYPGMIMIDPPGNFLGSTNDNSYGEVRKATKNLVAWLDQKRIACNLVKHLNKNIGKGLDGIERIIGSTAWGTVARVTVGFAKDPDQADTLVCGGTKNNLGPMAEVLAYRIEKANSIVSIDWVGKSTVSIEDAMNKVKRKSRGACAVEWLTERFREKFEWESDELVKAARESGISRNALFSDEVSALPIKKRPRTNAAGQKDWYWVADKGWPPPEKSGTGQLEQLNSSDANLNGSTPY